MATDVSVFGEKTELRIKAIRGNIQLARDAMKVWPSDLSLSLCYDHVESLLRRAEADAVIVAQAPDMLPLSFVVDETLKHLDTMTTELAALLKERGYFD